MITRIPASERGLTKLNWLTSYHSFSFNRFYDPNKLHFGPLRVLNDDLVQPGAGFGAHPHDNMEIVTYVMEGELEHRDNSGGHGVIRAGDVQRMRAGTGIVHSEYNNSQTSPVHFLQIWFFPSEENLTPGYEQKTFTRAERLNTLLPVASPAHDAVGVNINTPATMYIGAIENGTSLQHKINSGNGAYVFLVGGTITLNGTLLQTGDAATAVDESLLNISASADAEIVLMDVIV